MKITFTQSTESTHQLRNRIVNSITERFDQGATIVIGLSSISDAVIIQIDETPVENVADLSSKRKEKRFQSIGSKGRVRQQ